MKNLHEIKNKIRKRLIFVLSIYLTVFITALSTWYGIINLELILDISPSKQPIAVIIVTCYLIKKIYDFSKYVLEKIVSDRFCKEIMLLLNPNPTTE